MGQRSQIYVRINNIGKAWAKKHEIDDVEKYEDNVPQFLERNEIYERWKQMYGEEDTAIVAFHHQWLYGQSFVLMASRLLFAVNALNSVAYDYDNILKIEYSRLKNPHNTIDWIKSIMENSFDYQLRDYSRIGIERLSLLNEEHVGENYSYSEDFTIGDNNDGVLIIDCTQKHPKYCFVNINGDSTVNKLPMLKPVDASTYIRAYYPESLLDCSKEEIKSLKEERKIINFQKNITTNKKFLDRIKEFKVLTVDNLVEIFPKLQTQLTTANL